MGQVPARRQVHPQNGIARLQQRLEHALVGLAARIGLHIGISHAKQLASPRNCQIFGNIDIVTAAVIALARIAFGVFVGHHRALSFHHGAADDVF